MLNCIGSCKKRCVQTFCLFYLCGHLGTTQDQLVTHSWSLQSHLGYGIDPVIGTQNSWRVLQFCFKCRNFTKCIKPLAPEWLDFFYICRTLTTSVKLLKCLRAIKEFAFQVSEYPVVITFEDHLTADLQEKVAKVRVHLYHGYIFYCWHGFECTSCVTKIGM